MHAYFPITATLLLKTCPMCQHMLRFTQAVNATSMPDCPSDLLLFTSCIFLLSHVRLPLPCGALWTTHGTSGDISSPDSDAEGRLHMMQGFPGTLSVNATYNLTEDNQLQLVIQATTDATTPVNLAQHSYFNLNGEASGQNILNHDIFIDGYAAAAQT